MSKHQNTKLEAEGAEFMVLGLLLVEGLQCFKAYTNFEGYDLVALDTKSQKTARIQVKSRWATDYDHSFLISSFECDFVVFAELNRGYRYRKTAPAKAGDKGRKPPRFFCFPVKDVRDAQASTNSLGKVPLKQISGWESYQEKWELIREFLGQPTEMAD